MAANCAAKHTEKHVFLSIDNIPTKVKNILVLVILTFCHDFCWDVIYRKKYVFFCMFCGACSLLEYMAANCAAKHTEKHVFLSIDNIPTKVKNILVLVILKKKQVQKPIYKKFAFGVQFSLRNSIK